MKRALAAPCSSSSCSVRLKSASPADDETCTASPPFPLIGMRDVQYRILDYVLAPEAKPDGYPMVQFLRLQSVCRDWQSACLEYIDSPARSQRYAGMLDWAKKLAWLRPRNPNRIAQGMESLLQASGAMAADLNRAGSHRPIASSGQPGDVNISQPEPLSLLPARQVTLNSRVTISTGSELSQLFEWLQSRACSVELTILSAAQPKIEIRDRAQWKGFLDQPQWKGKIIFESNAFACPLAQVLSHTDWQLCWQYGELRAGHGAQLTAPVHDMTWTDEPDNIDLAPIHDKSQPATHERRLIFPDTEFSMNEGRGIHVQSLRWNQNEQLCGVSPFMLSSSKLTDLNLSFLRADTDPPDELFEAPFSAVLDCMHQLAQGGALRRMLLQVSEHLPPESLIEALMGNPSLESVSLISLSKEQMCMPLMQALGSLKELRQLCLVDFQGAPDLTLLQELLTSSPQLEDLRLAWERGQPVDEAWCQKAFPWLAAHSGLARIDVLGEGQVDPDAFFAPLTLMVKNNAHRRHTLHLVTWHGSRVIEPAWPRRDQTPGQ